MIIEGLILAAIAVAQVASAIYIVFLVINEIINWFQSARKIGANQIGFTLQDRLKNGKYKTVQGIFNNSTQKVDAMREVKSSRIDDELASYHRYNNLVVYD